MDRRITKTLPSPSCEKKAVAEDITTLEHNMIMLRDLNRRLEVAVEMIDRVSNRVQASLTGEANEPTPEKPDRKESQHLSGIISDYGILTEQILAGIESLSRLV